MADRIRVLIADDQAISREGVRRILEGEDDIEVVGIVDTAPAVLAQARKKRPDVVLLDLKWHHDGRAMLPVISQLSQDCPESCVIGLTVYDGLIEAAREAGAKWAITKDIGKDELLSLIRTAYMATTGIEAFGEIEEARAALRTLRGLETGRGHATHEKAVCRILETVLCPPLTNLRPQASTIRSRRRDILFSNYSQHLFWSRMSQNHDATQVIFELKNVKELRVSHVDQVAAYLTPEVGRLAFIVARFLAGKRMIQHAIDLFSKRREVILFLCDDDLERMLDAKEMGGDPTELIEEKYDHFIAQLP